MFSNQLTVASSSGTTSFLLCSVGLASSAYNDCDFHLCQGFSATFSFERAISWAAPHRPRTRYYYGPEDKVRNLESDSKDIETHDTKSEVEEVKPKPAPISKENVTKKP